MTDEFPASTNRAQWIAHEGFAELLGTRMVEQATDHVVVQLPYTEALGVGRIHGGAISALVDIAATAAFWTHPELSATAKGATIGFTINFLRLAVATDLFATASVRRRGGQICTGDVSICDPQGLEVAVAVVTYKLDRGVTSA